jgi:hypothetical protein
MPADYGNRRNEIRNIRMQDSISRRAVNESRRQERIARLDNALLSENNEPSGLARNAQLAVQGTQSGDAAYCSSVDRFT